VVAFSSQLSLLDCYLIIRKYNELNHRDRAQINYIKSDKTYNKTSVKFPDHHILIDYVADNFNVSF
jgi:hypothetical protein